MIEKPDLKDLDAFKRKVSHEIKELDRKVKDLGKPQFTFEKDLKALENRIT